ncbi:ovochymase-2 [Pelodytes ibericus]
MPARVTSIALILTMMSYIENGGTAPLNPKRASRCGEALVDETVNFNILSRIVGGQETDKGQHPWAASLKRDGKHFCGGTIVSATHIITAAHCVADKNVLVYLKVYIGDFDLKVKESAEKIFPVRSIQKHPNFNPSRPINYDIAVLELNGYITFDDKIQPICLPNPDDVFEPGFLCVALGWGRLKENGVLPTTLQEVSLPIIEPKRCTSVMATLQGVMMFDSILCAGFPEGGKDACQGDSGGPLVCQRTHGSWVLVGVTSWGMGCGRNWDRNVFLLPQKRGSPGVFTDIQKVLRWLYRNLDHGKWMKVQLEHSKSCSVKDGILSGTEGEIQFPNAPNINYANNEVCEWIIKVPKGKLILINFSRFDVESDFSCDLDYLSIYSEERRLIGKFCGDVCPRPIIVSSNRITLKFLSDFQEYRTGFALNYSAVEPGSYSDSDCGSLAIHFEEGEIQSMNYPKSYANFANCHWVIHAPKYYKVKLTFIDFQIEAGVNCSYDSVRVYEDLAAGTEIGKFCGFSIPPAVFSSGNMMHIKFSSDATESYRGFRAAFSFVMSNHQVCGVSPIPPRFLYSKLTRAEEALPYSWPWHVSLQFAAEHMCDGTIITEDWILTSASCVSERKKVQDLWLVAAGLHELSGSENNQKRSVREIFVHPKFTRQTMDYNMALLQMTEPFRFNRFVRPVCLPSKDSEPKPSSLCVVSGWGLNGREAKERKLQQLEVPILEAAACRDYYRTHPGGITERMLCAGFPTGRGNDTCSDQSGGPLVCLLDNTELFTLAGIVSWAVSCRQNSKPGVYTKVPILINWIDQIIKGSDPAAISGSNSTQNVYFASGCEDVILLLSPGEIKLETKDQIYPNGFSCQWRIIAPKDQIIKLDLKQLQISKENKKCCSSIVVYEGVSSDNRLKAQLTEDMVPCTIWSDGPALTIEMSTNSGDPQLGFWLVYTFHDTHRSKTQVHIVPHTDWTGSKHHAESSMFWDRPLPSSPSAVFITDHRGRFGGDHRIACIQ